MFAIVIMSVKGSGWPPAPPLFNNPIITGSNHNLCCLCRCMQVTSALKYSFKRLNGNTSLQEEWTPECNPQRADTFHVFYFFRNKFLKLLTVWSVYKLQSSTLRSTVTSSVLILMCCAEAAVARILQHDTHKHTGDVMNVVSLCSPTGGSNAARNPRMS